MTNKIHTTAVVDPAAQIGADVLIGPYCVVGPHVTLGNKVQLLSHVVLSGHTTIGAETTIYPFASLGSPPQDLKFKGETSQLVIGKNNQIREHVTMNPGTEGGGLITRIGDNGLFMVGAHVAHDCQIGNHVVLANNATLAGHVMVGDHAIIGGLAAVHQFVRIGAHAMIGGMSAVVSDVIPFGTAMGERAHLAGLNIVGLERNKYSRDDIQTLRNVYRLLFASDGVMADRLDEITKQYSGSPAVERILEFVRNRGSRALCQPAQNQAA